MLGQNLRQLWESLGPEQCLGLLSEGLEQGTFKPADFSLRELAESFCGHDWVRRLNPRNLERFSTLSLMEAGEGVDVSAFSNITGQILYTKILDGWKQAVSVAESLVEHTSTQFDGEKLPWLGMIRDEGDDIHDGMPFPETTFGERFIETPRTTKRGEIVSITKEMIFFDRTSQALKRANSIGERVAMRKRKLILDCVMGVTNTYKLNGTSLNTYLTSGSYINSATGVELIDWTAIEQAYILASKILDPDSNNPIDIEFKQLLVMPAKLFTAKRVTSATEIRSTSPGYATTGVPQQTVSGNPLPDHLEVLTDKIAYQRLLAAGVTSSDANKYWFIGDFKRAFAYMENWPLTVVQAPPNSLKEFENDIVVRVKASERGVPAVMDPRYVMKFTG